MGLDPYRLKLEKLNFDTNWKLLFFESIHYGLKLFIYSNDKVTFGVKSCVYINYQNRGVDFRENLEI